MANDVRARLDAIKTPVKDVPETPLATLDTSGKPKAKAESRLNELNEGRTNPSGSVSPKLTFNLPGLDSEPSRVSPHRPQTPSPPPKHSISIETKQNQLSNDIPQAASVAERQASLIKEALLVFKSFFLSMRAKYLSLSMRSCSLSAKSSS